MNPHRTAIVEAHRQATEALSTDPSFALAPTSHEVRAVLRHHDIEIPLAEIVETCVALGLSLADAPEPTRRLTPIH